MRLKLINSALDITVKSEKMKKIQLSEKQLKTVIHALDVCYNKGLDGISGLQQIGISENTVNAYIMKYPFLRRANEINKQKNKAMTQTKKSTMTIWKD